MSTAVEIPTQLGGSGKTPITIILAGALAKLGLKMLDCDFDGQGDLTTDVGFDDEIFADNGASIYTLLTQGEGKLRPLTCRAPNDAIDVLPGNIQM